MTRQELYKQYRQLLMDGIVPFWWKYGVDHEFGGVLSCMNEDGSPISSDKYIWSQARFAWVCAALFNRIEARPEFLDAARRTVEFLLAHGSDAVGRWIYRSTREGKPVEGPVSIYSDCFAVYGLSEYYRASHDPAALEIALETYRRIRYRVEDPDFADVAPYKLPSNRRPHAVPMILTEVSNELAITTGDASIEAAAEEYVTKVLDHFVRPEWRVLVEFLDRQYGILPGNEGSAVMPGHAIESMWFILRWAYRRKRDDVIERAAEVIRWHLEAGWDPQYGGIFLGIDAMGREPFLANAEKKLWWPHTEALYGLLLAHRLTGEAWCWDWYQRVHDWSFRHFGATGYGEWRQRLDREGSPIADLIALPVKDPFHLPRAVILILELLAEPEHSKEESAPPPSRERLAIS